MLSFFLHIVCVVSFDRSQDEDNALLYQYTIYFYRSLVIIVSSCDLIRSYALHVDPINRWRRREERREEGDRSMLEERSIVIVVRSIFPKPWYR